MPTTVQSRDEVIGSVLVGLGEMFRDLRCAAAEPFVKHGASMTQVHVLRHLEQHGPMPMSRLADLLDVSVSNATGLIDRMVERGLVERVGDPEDRRVVLVRPSAAGLQALDDADGIKLERMRGICERLDDAQLQRISTAIAELRNAIAAEFPQLGKGRD